MARLPCQVRQDLLLVSNELRQVKSELAKARGPASNCVVPIVTVPGAAGQSCPRRLKGGAGQARNGGSPAHSLALATAVRVAETLPISAQVKLEQNAVSTVQQICSQANKAVAAHAVRNSFTCLRFPRVCRVPLQLGHVRRAARTRSLSG